MKIQEHKEKNGEIWSAGYSSQQPSVGDAEALAMLYVFYQHVINACVNYYDGTVLGALRCLAMLAKRSRG